jgi:hypothetical protein
MVVTSSFTHRSITFINQRFRYCRPNVDIGSVKLTLDSFCGNRIFEMNISSAVPCTAVVVWFFVTVVLNVWRSHSVKVFRSLFLFVDVVFPWFSYTDMTLETVVVDTRNNVAIFIRDVPAKRPPTICPLSKSDKSPIFLFSHTDCHSAESLMYWCERYRVQTNGRSIFSDANWSSLNVANTNRFYSSIS